MCFSQLSPCTRSFFVFYTKAHMTLRFNMKCFISHVKYEKQACMHIYGNISYVMIGVFLWYDISIMPKTCIKNVYFFGQSECRLTSCRRWGRYCALWPPCAGGPCETRISPPSKTHCCVAVALALSSFLWIPVVHLYTFQPATCRQQICSQHRDEAWCSFVIKLLSWRIDWDKDALHMRFI